ncbi:MAG TPA: calcium-binding protein [Actinomycetota bacterium]|nr:calcium-binding protein [Actinomycetota bacterium]
MSLVFMLASSLPSIPVSAAVTCGIAGSTVTVSLNAGNEGVTVQTDGSVIQFGIWGKSGNNWTPPTTFQQCGTATLANTTTINVQGENSTQYLDISESTHPLRNSSTNQLIAVNVNGGSGNDEFTFRTYSTPETRKTRLGMAAGGAITYTVVDRDNDGASDMAIHNLGGTQAKFTVQGGAGNDHIIGGEGGFTATAPASGTATRVGTTRNMTLLGGAGDDKLWGGQGNDTLDCGTGNDVAIFGHLNNRFQANLGTDYSVNATEEGNDAVKASCNGFQGGPGGADIIGQSGAGITNVFQSGPGNDVFTAGGSGAVNIVSYAERPGPVSANLCTQTATGDGSDTFTGILNLIGSDGPDTIATGTESNNRIDGAPGADTLSFCAGSGVTVDLAATGPQNTVGAGSNKTFLNLENVIATPGNDTIMGSALNNVLDGAAGTDTVSFAGRPNGVRVNLSLNTAQDTRDGNDTILNFENLTGTAFNDVLSGNALDNRLDGGAGQDIVTHRGRTGPVTVNLATGTASGEGADVLLGIDHASGSEGNDTITGNGAANHLWGRGGNDQISGADGDDTISGGPGDDVLDAGLGVDNVSYEPSETGVTVNLGVGGAQNTVGDGTDTLSGFEQLTGSRYDDTLTGGSGNDVLRGGPGNDTIDGAGGNDGLQGGPGNDVLTGGAGIDSASYSQAAGGVTVDLAVASAQNTGGDGSDQLSGIENLTGSDHADTLKGDGGSNNLRGKGGNDTLLGGGGNDTLFGHEGINTLDGQGGDDVLYGGSSDDTLTGGDGNDTVSYFHAAAGVLVDLRIVGPQATVGAGTDNLSGVENLSGSAFNDTLHATNVANVLHGGAGNDILHGYDGNDVLRGDAGDDSLFGGDGDDDLDGGRPGTNVCDGGAGTNALTNCP